MSITRKSIKEILPDIEDDDMKKLMALIHGETDTLRDANEDLQKQLDKAKSDTDTATKAKEKAENDLKSFRDEQEAKATKTAKTEAVRTYFREKGITTDKSLALAVRSASAEIDSVVLENGKIKDSKALDDLISGDLSGLVSTKKASGAETKTPSGGSGTKYSTKEEIMAIKDVSQRRQAISENHELFGF